MRRAVVFLSAFLLAVAATAATALDTSELNRITFGNDTGYEIVHLFFSPGDSDFWGADVLGSTRTIEDGDEVSFYIHYPDASDTFDFLAIDEDGDAYVIWDYEVSDDSEGYIDLTLDDLSEDEYNLGFTRVSLDNTTGEELYYFFFSPSDSSMYGIDMLDDETTLEDGDTLTLLVPVSAKTSTYDIIGVTESGDEYGFSIDINNSKKTFHYAVESTDSM